MMGITKEEKSILFHTLGLNYKPISFRNHFVASKNHSDYKTLESLREKGLMELGKAPSFCPESDILYHVTTKGKEIAISEKKKSIPKLTRSQKRYKAFLLSDTTESFIEWLQNPYWDNYRKRVVS